MTEPVDSRPTPARPQLFLLAFALAKFLAHMFVGRGYGYFRDEFYYIACSDHLAWGYVDHPPFSILMMRLGRFFMGESVIAIRVLPALAGAATVYLAGWMARALGGGRFAQAMAMLAVIVAPAYLGTGNYFSMNSFDVLFWAVAAALLIRILNSDAGGGAGEGVRIWLLLGMVLGLGLMNKLSVLWLGLGLLVGLLATPSRRLLLTRGPWLAGAVSIALFLPHVIWQVVHGWPTLEFIRNATGQKMQTVAFVDFLTSQFLTMHPLNAPIWIAGLAFFLVFKDGRRFRLLGWVYVAVLLLLLLNRTSRPGYLGPAYTMLFAAGGVAIETVLNRFRLRWPKPVLPGLLLAGGALLAPFAMPILPVPAYISYARFVGIGPSTDERKELGALPQHYADMFGWDELVDTLGRVYRALPDEERAVAGIFVFNYGEAGAIDLLGRRHGLPQATSGHNNYWLWGPRGYSGEVLVIVGGSKEGHERYFDNVEQVATTDCGHCMPYEDDQPVFICRGLQGQLDDVWPGLKHFN